MLATKLSHTEGKPNSILHGLREIKQICLGRTNPEKWLFSRHTIFSSHRDYPSFRMYESIGILQPYYARSSAASLFRRPSLLIRINK